MDGQESVRLTLKCKKIYLFIGDPTNFLNSTFFLNLLHPNRCCLLVLIIALISF